MKYTDYNALYLSAKGKTPNQPDEKQAESEPKEELPVNQEESSVAESDTTDDTKPEEPVSSKQEATPVTEEPEVTEPPVQSTLVSGIGNNSEDLDDFASEFDKKPEEIAFVEPVAVSMPAAPVKQDSVYESENKDEDNSEPAKQPKKEAFTRPAPYVPKKKSEDDDNCETARVRDIPKVLITRVQQLFSCRPNQGDAISAYIYLKEGCPANIDVPERVKEVAKSYCGEIVSNEDIQADLMAELNKIRNNDKQLMQKINAIELAVIYAIFDRLGFRKGDISDESRINFTEAGMHELLDNLETSSINYQTRLKKSEGRMKI